jgi:hypothetical protein
MGIATFVGDRPSSWDFPLFLHVLGAMALVGGVVLTLFFLVGAWRGNADAIRLALRSIGLAVLPGYIVMRGAAEWIYSKEGWDKVDPSPNWLGIGYGVADFGILLIGIAALVAWLARRQGGTGIAVRIAALVIGFVLVMDVVAIWAMTTKPV